MMTMNTCDFICETSPNSLRTIFSELNELRKTATLCDVMIRVGDSVFPCHRNLLSSSCDYFKIMFRNTSFVEKREESVELQNIEPSAFEQILNFIYTGKVRITDGNLSSLLMSSEYLGLHYLEDLCRACIEEHIPMNNIGRLFQFALKTEKSNLVDKLCTYIAVNFEELSKSDELISLSGDALTRILTCPKLQSSSSARTSFLLKWMDNHRNLVSASNTSSSLDTSIKYFLEMIAGNNQAQDFIPKAKKNLIQSNQSLLRFFTLECQSKSSRFLFSLKLKTDRYYYRVCMYEIRPLIKMMSGGRKIISGIHKTPPIISMKSVVLNKEIMYVFCNDGDETFPSIFTKGPTMSIDSLRSSSLEIPKEISLALLQRRIYFYSPEHFIVYDCDVDFWFPWKIENILPVRNPCVVSLNDSIYVVGGWPTDLIQNESGGFLQHVDPRTCVSNRLPNSLFVHTNAAACVYDDKIYVTGGTNISYYDKVVEVFEPVANKWRALASMPRSKMEHTLVPHKKHLYAIGGQIKKGGELYNDLNTCVYDVESDKWLETISVSTKSTGGNQILKILDAVVF